jgi:hypothetical protein
MTSSSFLQWTQRRLDRDRRAGPDRSRRRTARPGFVPHLEALEDRTLPSTFTVLNLNDSGPGSLRDALASGDDTINFAKGLHGTITLTSGELLISNRVTINGPGAGKLSVSGDNASRVFEVATGLNVAINGLTVTDGYAVNEGGGIRNDGSNLALSADNLTQNVVYESATDATSGAANLYASGGALYSVAGSLTINGCQITSNQALATNTPTAFGVGIGGGLNFAAGSATITDSTINGNLVEGGSPLEGNAYGGGLFTLAPLTITDCVLTDNRAVGRAATGSDASGGALALEAATTISDTTFSANAALGGNGGTSGFAGEAEGGTIVIFGPIGGGLPGTDTISGCAFVNNLAVAGSDSNSGPGQADPGVDESFGAGIFNFGGIINVSDTTFSHNTSIGGNNAIATGTDIVEVGVAEGGAICNEIGATASFSDCTFDHNQAIGGNGNTGSGPVVHVGTGFGAGIFSGFGGAGSFVGSTSLTVSGTTFTHNTSQGGDDNSGTATVAGLVGVGVGAGIMNALGGSASITGSELDHNQATGGHHNSASGSGAVFVGLGAGGGILNYLGSYNSSGYGPFDASVVSVSNSTIDHNQAQGGGGNGAGGGLANLLSATTTVNSTALTNNQANGDGSGAGLGGGAFNDATSRLTLTAASVTQNHANGSPGIGGGIYTLGTFSEDASTVITDNHASTSDDNIGP